ncbi:MAG: glycosyltransferase family 39 protein [Candidatus Nitricoxidivorans perseverans]|uniref:Glycosyltransferase family 39 protein n=1 Tax=Candidatus Nitricoxidivorans perseverans TaxID=2975601 RepID=A0AA49FL26_9PROT|nr:MAG: glycosyltransferase family 39 protein [Candidatus Nitricoxidivorans perseverans]
MTYGGPDSRRLFWALLPLALAFRFWLAAAFPITGDEAYFVDWGRHPDWGFYDHPPMVGWWLAALLSVSGAEWWLRLPAVVQPAFLALAVAWTLSSVCRDVERERAWWAALLVLLAPVDVWNVFITTDTPLVYFAVLSGLAWLKAGRSDDDPRWYLAAGLLLAGAVLSKYFAALLGFAYLIDVLLVRRRPRAWAGLAVAYAAVLPALTLMAWWNAGHCWTNVLFNFVNRHEDAGFSWRTPLLYAATLAYVLTPPGLWLLLRGDPSRVGRRSLAMLSAIPFLIFAGLSLVKTVGLHWLLAFVPFALLWLALSLPLPTLRRLATFFIGFAALHVAAIAVASRLPLETWQRLKIHNGVVLTFESQALLERLKPFGADHVFAMDGYSSASTLGFNSQKAGGQRFIVLGPGSSHARNDDFLTDFRTLDGKNILVLRKTEPRPDEYRPWFREVAIERFDHRGARFWVVRGRGFDYVAYRDGVLAKARDAWYAVPRWLPQTGCYFCDRYFGGSSCIR